MGNKRADDGDTEPSLELPSLKLPGFGRRKHSKQHPEPETASDTTPTAPLSVQEQPEPVVAREPEGPPAPHRADRSGFSLPAIPGALVAVITGLVVGMLGTALTYLAMAGCESVRGTSTCGGPGFFLLVAILSLMILGGALLLKAWQVSDPGSTSFLAVGLVAVIVLLTLIDVAFSAWMFVAVPMVSAASYVLSRWVTTRFVDEDGQGPPPDDVR